jgi:hypothetical protein
MAFTAAYGSQLAHSRTKADGSQESTLETDFDGAHRNAIARWGIFR